MDSRGRPMPRESQGQGRFREPLDLSHIVRQFERRAIPGGEQDDLTDYRDYVMPAHEREDVPMPIRVGPLTASTSRVLAPARQTWAWDPNRYYRGLGVPWPYVNASRADLREAYVAADGQSSPRLTYCFKQLLNFREEYDRLPLGVLYMNDIYVQEALKQKAAEEAKRRTAEGNPTTADEVLDEQGFVLSEEDPESPEDALDDDHLKRQDEPTVGAQWLYGFYLWGTHYPESTDLLRDWQAALLGEINGGVPSLAVGLVGRKEKRDYAVTDVNGQTVVFIRHDLEVTEALVADAVHALLNHQQHQIPALPSAQPM